MDVKDKVVLLTGASEGIGKAIAELLASHGAILVAAARSIDKLNEIVKPFNKGLAVKVDMMQPESIKEMVEKVIQHYGRIDILINCAGRALLSEVKEIKIRDFEEIMHLNVYGPLLAMQAVIPHMEKNGGGLIINISSNVSKMALPMIGAYAATKYALNGLSLTARAELAAKNIVVTLVHPGRTNTNFGKNAIKHTELARPPGSTMQADTAEQVAEKVLEAIKNEPAEQYMNPEIEKHFARPTE